MIFILLLIGVGVGCLSALLGIGGGVLLVPFLPKLTGWSEHQVVGVTLFVIMVNSFANLVWFHRKGLVNWVVLRGWGPAAGLGSFLGSYGATRTEGVHLRLVLLGIVFVMILKTFRDFYMGPFSKKIFNTSDWSFWKSGLGVFVGSLSGFAGIGTGLVSNLIFISRRWVGKDEASPTGNGVMFFVGLFSCFSFVIFGGDRGIDLNFFKAEMWPLLCLIASVLSSSFFFRPLNVLIVQSLRFFALLLTLICVFCYVFVEITM